ncbi:MAG: RimK family alpha-L-glutamate ligase [Acidobacteria bacterium]|nr:MAG: RimK family alpha-L-glutamate ligase [Acidobacteriota bacterium]
MRIAILSRSSKLYSTRRMVEAVEARGHRADVLDVLDFAISLEEEYPDLYYRGEPLDDYDAVIPRIGASVTYFGTAVVRQFEQMDVFSANSALGIMNSRDKLRCLQILSRYNVGIPASEFVRRKEDVLPAIERVGGAPVIIKLLEGTQGVGVILADNEKIAQAIIETLQSTKHNVLIQKFVAESKGRDVRAFVVGDRVVAAMRRVAQGQEFRSNVHRGGRAEAITLDERYEATAVRAAQIVGLRVAGVDMLESQDGPQIMEVNSSPGLEGIEGATRIDVAGAIAAYVEDQVHFPEMDIRQRLTVSRGYGVAELPIGEASELLGKTIATSGLRDRDVLVLTLNRDGRVIANPRGDRDLRVGDRILCFGRLEVLKSFLPKRKPRRLRRLKSPPPAP